MVNIKYQNKFVFIGDYENYCANKNGCKYMDLYEFVFTILLKNNLSLHRYKI
jgi:hypothetical protein